MKFNSEVYNQIYHAENNEAGNGGNMGGVVDPQQPKDSQKPEEQTDAQKQSDKDININIRVDAGEKPADETAETENSQPDNEAGATDPKAASESEGE